MVTVESKVENQCSCGEANVNLGFLGSQRKSSGGREAKKVRKMNFEM